MRLLSLVLTLAFAATPLLVTAETTAPAPTAAVNLPAITVSKVETHLLSDVVFASGLVNAVEQVQVQPQIEGQAIQSIDVEIGDWVTEGQVLARLSDTYLSLQRSQLEASRASALAAIAQGEASLIEAKSTADEADRIAKRTKALAANGTSPKSSVDTAAANATSAAARVTVASQGLVAAEAQLHLVDAQIANLDLNLQRTVITSPVTGEVVQRNAMVGAIASGNGAAMFTIVRDGRLELRADVAEQDVLRLAVGQTVILTSPGLPDPLTGKVTLVEPTVDAVSRLGRVRVSFEQSDMVRSGMFADARILVAQRDTIAVPVSAIGGGDAGATALQVTDGVVTLRQVVTGIRDSGMVEVLEGLVAGDTVVTKAGAFVRDGDHINPVPAEATATPSN